jgi:hypothetical protein
VQEASGEKVQNDISYALLITHLMLVIFRFSLQEYVLNHPAGRGDDDVTYITIKQGFEPLMFTGFFPMWDATLWSVSVNTILLS